MDVKGATVATVSHEQNVQKRKPGVRYWPLYIFFLALGIRLAAQALLPEVRLNPDAAEYEHLAAGIVMDGTYGFRPDWRQNPLLAHSQWRFLYDENGTGRPPGYPALVAALTAVFGPEAQQKSQAILRAVCGAVSAVLVFKCAELLFTSWAGVIAGLLFAFSPTDVGLVLFVGRDTVVTMFVCGAMCLIAIAVTRGSIRPLLLAGVVLGLGMYLKETIVCIGIAFFLWSLWFAIRRSRRLVFGAVLMLALAGAVVSPWVIRNTMRTGHLTGLSITSGTAMWLGIIDPNWKSHAPLSDMDWSLGLEEPSSRKNDPFAAATPSQADAGLRENVKAYAWRHPGQTASAMIRNAAIFWSPVPRSILQGDRKFGAVELCTVLEMLTFVLAGIWALWRLRGNAMAWYFAVLLLVVTAIHLPFCAYPRYRVPYQPALMILLAGLAHEWRLHRKRQGPPDAQAVRKQACTPQTSYHSRFLPRRK